MTVQILNVIDEELERNIEHLILIICLALYSTYNTCNMIFKIKLTLNSST